MGMGMRMWKVSGDGAAFALRSTTLSAAAPARFPCDLMQSNSYCFLIRNFHSPFHTAAAPDLEWLFYLRNDGEEPAVGRMWVDGLSIGYDIKMEAKRVRNGIGLWNVRGNIQSDTALQFSLQTNRSRIAPKNDISTSPRFGRVVVDFYEDLGSGVEKRHPDLDRDGGADFQKEQAKVNQTDQIGGACAGKKAFQTDVGGHQTAEEVCEPMVGEFKLGKRVGSVTIQYCSTLGLIHKGILPNTPQQTAGGAVNAPMKGSEGIDTSAAGAIRPDLEKEEEEKKEEVTGEGLEIVSSCSEPARKKSKIGEK